MKKLFKIVALLLTTSLILSIFIFKPIEKRDDYFQSNLHKNTKTLIDTTNLSISGYEDKNFCAGWASENITPGIPVRIAGYGIRQKNTGILDSLYVKTFVFLNNYHQYAIVSPDLIMIHPDLAKVIRKTIIKAGLNFDGIYFGAIHSHTSYGHWGKDLSNRVAFGNYKKEITQMIAEKTVKSLKKALQTAEPANLSYGECKLSNVVKNHFGSTFYTDSVLRYIKIKKKKGKTAVISSFSGHPTYLSPKYNRLSADFPGQVAKMVTAHDSISFSMYLAGAVAAHKLRYNLPKTDSTYGKRSYKNMTAFASVMADSIIKNHEKLFMCNCQRMLFREIPIEIPHAQLRVGDKLALRPWFFHFLIGKHDSYVQYFQLGNIHFISAPGDISGEFYKTLQPILDKEGERLNLTSFNGTYIGYIIPEIHYNSNQSEAREMNWYGPHLGTHFEYIISELLKKNRE